jgi:hypothetical protein
MTEHKWRVGDKARLHAHPTSGAEFLANWEGLETTVVEVHGNIPKFNGKDRKDGSNINFWWEKGRFELIGTAVQDVVENLRVAVQQARYQGYSVEITVTSPPKTETL